ncbi:hypothetical protein J3D47_005605 [Pseudomonas laurylsulfativorans]|uniref:hypothetical protein n=1 Tax=Pseudomonas laurylsulfativorans TaxID=1943631 RepID=UPI0020A0C54B|nr:hypothetical protein [Pseudomonas laurylsulfativorans]MCP1421362.1 hypothetical protein [Pseudomonas laurylsulfativorans]
MIDYLPSWLGLIEPEDFHVPGDLHTNNKKDGLKKHLQHLMSDHPRQGREGSQFKEPALSCRPATMNA